MDPAIATILVRAGDFPENAGRDAPTFGEGSGEFVPDASGTPDFVHEGGLQDSGDAQGGGGEEDAEGRVRADEEVLGLISTRERGKSNRLGNSWPDLRADRRR